LIPIQHWKIISRNCCVKSLKAKVGTNKKKRRHVCLKKTMFFSAPFLVVGVESGRVGRLPEHQQRRLVTEPDDESTRRVRRRREIRRNVRLEKRRYISHVETRYCALSTIEMFSIV
jgi:hypothetical protein